MHTDLLNDAKIIDSWNKNALPWAEAVREGRIESRQRITNRAIIEAVLSRSPNSVLDVGCGEGWLMRALAEHDINVIGVDAIPSLVDAARHASSGDVRMMTYEQIATGKLEVAVDVLVCNFSLLGRDPVHGIFTAAPSLVNPGGSLIIQTIHPLIACGDFPYEDGWREGSWAGCGDGFSEPAPWYFRTMESWVAMFSDHDMQDVEIRETVHPDTGQLSSVILIGKIS